MNRLFTFLLVIGILVVPSLYSQNPRITLSAEDVVINKAKNGYELYVRKIGDIDRIELFVNAGGGKLSYLYEEDGGIVEASKVVKDRLLGQSFYIFIPSKTFIDSSTSGNEYIITENMDVVIKTYSASDYKKNNNIILHPQIIKNNIASLSIEGIEDGLDYVALYLLYSGSNNGEYAFYFREGRESIKYNLLPTIWGISDTDGVAIILKDTYTQGIGKQLLVKIYFDKKREERYIGLNVFDKNGNAKTSQLEYVIGNYIPPVIERKTIQSEVKQADIEIAKKRVIEKPEDNKLYLEDDITNTLLIRPSEIKDITTNATPQPKRDINIVDFEKSAKELGKNIDLPDELKNNIFGEDKSSLDLVIILDTTMSMDEVILILKSSIQELAKKVFNEYEYARIGFVLFRDIGSDYVTKVIPYMRDYRDVVSQLKYVTAYGGGDLEEPIYEALDVALSKFDFKSKNRVALIITDTVSKVIGNATLSSTTNKANKLGVKIQLIKTRPAMRDIGELEKEILGGY